MDLINRQAAIEAIRKSTKKYRGFMEMEQYTDDDAIEAVMQVPSAQPDIRSIIKDMAVDEKYLSQWYQDSVMDDPPYWTDEHIKEVLYDFYLIPKQENEYEQ